MQFSQRISLASLYLMEHFPFFATMVQHTRFLQSTKSTTAWTDGRTVWFNPEFQQTLSDSEFLGVLLHEVLHCALKHPLRRQQREPVLFNIAADIVVNEMIFAQNLALPPGSIRLPEWARFSVEEIYALLLTSMPKNLQAGLRHFERDILFQEDPEICREIGQHWEAVAHQTITKARIMGQSIGHWNRLYQNITRASVDWRSTLWEFITTSASDYSGWDRRFIHQGWYLDALEGDSIQLFLACDTSASINDAELGTFLAEIKSILACYPTLQATLWFVDSALSEPHPLHPDCSVPIPSGGGGTSFKPFFEKVQQGNRDFEPACLLYFTDGFGEFPEYPPTYPALWAVTPGGLDSENFPFGQVIRVLPPD